MYREAARQRAEMSSVGGGLNAGLTISSIPGTKMKHLVILENVCDVQVESITVPPALPTSPPLEFVRRLRVLAIE